MNLAICNVLDSSIARDAAGVIYTHAGPEIGVASTKAFVTQLTRAVSVYHPSWPGHWSVERGSRASR
jgi:glucosamine 6-phosphate synthetase-like amidotransferase/phosphosugar isomerase protein